MDAGEPIKAIRGYRTANRFAWSRRFSRSRRFYGEMGESRGERDDVRCAPTNARSAKPQPKHHSKVVGPDRDGEELTIVVTCQDGLLIVTVW